MSQTYHTTSAGLLVTVGQGDLEHVYLPEGHVLVEGLPLDFDPAMAPSERHRWDTVSRSWVDVRTPREISEHELLDVLVARRKAYPPLTDLADALYWQSRGDSSKMDAYNAAVAAVKARYPKPAF